MRQAPRSSGGEEPPSSRAARAYAWATAGPLSFLIPVLWAVAFVLAILYLPSFPTGPSNDLTPSGAPAIRTEIETAKLFALPALSRVAVVQRDPAGLSQSAALQTVKAAMDIDRKVVPAPPGLLGALPIVNVPPAIPGTRERGTTAITYLFFDPATPWVTQQELAHRYAATYLTDPGASVVGVTGTIPARLEQEDRITAALPIVEIATVLLVAVIIALFFGSVLAPLITLLAAGLAYEIALRIVAWLGTLIGSAPPPELEPLIVVLLFGIVTDYAIFYLSGMRRELTGGERRGRAARRTTAQFTPLIIAAGLMVAAGTAALTVASQRFFRDFGPGMAVTVLLGLLVAVTLLPALLALFGHGLFWPRGVPAAERPEAERPAGPAPRPTIRERLSHLSTHRAVAVVVVVICVALLLVAASGLRKTRLGLDFLSSLPQRSEARRAADAASAGFWPGVLSPTEVLVRRPGIGTAPAAAQLEKGLRRQPGVAGVLGPLEQQAVPGVNFAVARGGGAVRYLVVFHTDPLGSTGIATYDSLTRAMPVLLAHVGLGGASAQYGGDTALAAYTVQRTVGDFGRIAVVVALVDLVLMAIFLRALVAPIYLLASSVLALAAALGLTTYLFQVVLGDEDLTYYVPFAASVLLVSLGSDYGIFLVGRIWQERRVRSLRSAIETAAPSARHAISVAAITLALSFSLLALVGLGPFRQLAFLLAVGVLIDSFIVRSLLVPALVALFGRTHVEAEEARAGLEAQARERRA
jgi:putative drug exporter of the RND superfamily